MREIFDARALELANRESRESRPTTSFLMVEIEGERWAIPSRYFSTVVETTPLECPRGVAWKGHACMGVLCWELSAYPVVDIAELIARRSPSESDYLFALLKDKSLALRLPRKASLAELFHEDLSPVQERGAKGKIGDILVLDMEAVL